MGANLAVVVDGVVLWIVWGRVCLLVGVWRRVLGGGWGVGEGGWGGFGRGGGLG